MLLYYKVTFVIRVYFWLFSLPRLVCNRDILECIRLGFQNDSSSICCCLWSRNETRSMAPKTIDRGRPRVVRTHDHEYILLVGGNDPGISTSKEILAYRKSVSTVC